MTSGMQQLIEAIFNDVIINKMVNLKNKLVREFRERCLNWVLISQDVITVANNIHSHQCTEESLVHIEHYRGPAHPHDAYS